MTRTLRLADKTPDWIVSLCKEIDTRKFEHAFDRFAQDAQMHFGAQTFRGAPSMKDFFVKIDSQLEISHRILETWSGDGYHFVRGEADMAKKDQPLQKVTGPFMWVFEGSIEVDGGIVVWRVTAGPLKTDAVM
jgi:hypothetical protein